MPDATYSIKIQGLDKLMAAMKASPEIMQPILQNAIVQSTVILTSHTDRATVPWISGTLARSFNPAKIETLLARWFPRVNYAMGVQFGTGPHDIFPKSLGYKGHPGGLSTPYGVFNKIHHPGFPGRFYMEKIRSASVDQINKEFKIAIDNFTKTIATQ